MLQKEKMRLFIIIISTGVLLLLFNRYSPNRPTNVRDLVLTYEPKHINKTANDLINEIPDYGLAIDEESELTMKVQSIKSSANNIKKHAPLKNTFNYFEIISGILITIGATGIVTIKLTRHKGQWH